jgi:hypothetical protein
MNEPLLGPAPDIHVHRALDGLKQAEIDLLAAIGLKSHPNNAVLIAAHAILREVISMLSKATASTDRG